MAQKRILIIGDSPETQQLLAESVLEPNGYRPIVALDGEDGLRSALEEHPDLIILDMQLPKMSGIEVLDALQERDIDIPVIFAAVRESPEVVVQAFRLGARDYVIKPCDPQEMQEAIQRAFATARVHEERDQLTQQLQRQLQELNAVYAIGRSVTSLLDLNRVLNRVVEAAVYMADAEEGMLLLLDSESGELYLRAAKGVDEEAVRSLRMRIDDSIAGRALRTDRPVLLTGEQAKVSTGYLVKALLYLPLRVPERGVIGVLGVVNRETARSFSERDTFLLSALADYAAIAIENARLFETVEVERAKLEAILREAEEAIVVVDEDDNILLCNTAARVALDLAEADLLHRPVGEAIPHPSLHEMFAQVRETGKATHNEVSPKDGLTFNAQLTPVEGVGRVLMMQDITHLKELDRIKSEFVATVSHDLRTPLTTIQGYIELLPRVGPLTAQQQEFIQRARESTETITELIGDLLDIGRIEAGFDLEMETCDLGQVIEGTVRDFRLRADHKGQELRWQPPETLLQAQGNPHRLRQVMDNLLGNAVKYTQEGGWIAVSAVEDGEYIVVHVADNGLGIHQAQQPYIFDKFYRVKSEETVDIKGTGLGLAIAKAVVEKHNGRVWVESKPGVGSVFSFVLPALKV
ncbi:MAG: response regulator [Chloroflexi bacterium]|nr:response regulator [Chloroflexota bacterium]